MADNIIPWNGITRLDSDPERVLADCAGKLASVVVIGYDHEGEEFFKSSVADGGTVLWLLERAKAKLLAVPGELA